MAGAGIRPGTRIGETDDLGLSRTGEALDVYDLHAPLRCPGCRRQPAL